MRTMARLATAARATGAALSHRLFLDRQAAFWLAELDELRSLDETRARIVEVIEETPDARTFVLRPNRRWRGHVPGQYVPVEVECDGVRVRRCYSITSAPGDAHVAITVKRIPGGRVSGWLHAHGRPGTIVRLGEAAGDFVLPAPAPATLLFVSGGSGITPAMAILRDLAARDAVHDVVFVHHARRRTDVIFREELEDLARRHPGLRLHVGLDDAPAPHGPFDEATFARQVPDFAARETFLCGPAPLMDRVERLWASVGASERLHRERFVAAPRRTVRPAGGAGGPVAVELSRSGRRVRVASGGPLLDELERAGERPAHGCRMGICHTCRCRKHNGTVENLVTGEVSEGDEDIRLCVSRPLSDLDLDL